MQLLTVIGKQIFKEGDQILTTDQNCWWYGWVHYSSGDYKDFLTLNRIPLPIPMQNVKI